jgi:hypothetical protein
MGTSIAVTVISWSTILLIAVICAFGSAILLLALLGYVRFFREQRRR